jgi:uncharacterized protein (DUF1501 family)
MTDDHRNCGCDDWHVSRRALLGAAADTIIGIPEEMLADGPVTALIGSRGITRKRMLAGAGGLAFAVAAMPRFGAKGLFEAAAAQAAADPNGRILVSIYLDGGNDGLNTLVPITDPRYRQLRTRIAIDPATTLPLADHPEFGWHPSLTGVKTLYDAGKVAVMPAVDYANPDQSHFNSQIFWRTGVVGQSFDRTGWLGRTIDALGDTSNPLQAISMGWNLDPILQSRRAPVATVFDPGGFGFSIPDVWSDEAALGPYRGATSGGRSTARKAAQQAYRGAIDVFDKLAPLRAQGDQVPPAPIPYPDEHLGNGLRNLARMLGAGFGTRLATISHGGFDTHNQQPVEHAQLLKTLGDSLVAWQADLDGRGLSDRVMTLVWSEFGRRAEDNDSNGTDHGAGGCVLLVGNHANGGIRSEFPGLTNLDPDGNLLVTTEFRNLYATLLESWLNVDVGRVLPGVDGRRLALIK